MNEEKIKDLLSSLDVCEKEKFIDYLLSLCCEKQDVQDIPEPAAVSFEGGSGRG